MRVSIVSVGDANIDFIAPISFFPKKGGEVLIDRLERRAGGSAANLSVAVSRIGLRSGFIGRVGADSFGHFLKDEFRKEKVDVSQLQVDEKVGTGLTFILVTEEGERTMFAFRGANAHLSANEIDMSYVQNAEAIHISGYSLLNDPQRGAALDAIKKVEEAGAFISFDPGIPATIKIADRVRWVLKFVDLLFLNEIEVKLLTGIKNIEKAARSALKMGPKIVALKSGKKGCIVLTKEKKIYSPAFSVKVADTSGAGDAFDAGFLTGVIKGWDLKKAARFANAVGALSTMKVGARSALPNRREVKRFLRRLGNAKVA